MKLIFLLSSFVLMIFNVVHAVQPYKPGDLADDFNLKNVSGRSVSLSDISDARGFIVVFTCNTCPVARAYQSRIIDLDRKFSSRGYPVIAINANDRNISPGDSYEEMQKLAKEKGFTFQYLYDESQAIAKKYGATNTPHVYVLSKKDGNLEVEYVGAIDNNTDDASKADKKYVEDAVNALLRGDKVQVTQTKAIGCGIKWKKS